MSNEASRDQEQKIAEGEVEKFRSELGPFVTATETTRMPMAFTDARAPDHPIIFANDAFLKLIGYERNEVLAQNFNFFLAGVEEKTLEEVEAAFANPSDKDTEINFHRKDERECWATLFVAPVEDERGDVTQHFLSLIDTTAYKMAEQHAGLLIDELKHRVKNSLMMVQSIVSQAIRNSPDPQAASESIETRIAALSRAHDLLGREKWDGAGLRDLVVEVLAPYREGEGRSARFVVEGDNIRLSPKATLALGMAFNELAANAVKYGALSNDTGTVSIAWTMEAQPDGRWLRLGWRETGGPTVSVPTRRGFGSRLIEHGLARELAGGIELDYPPEGVVCKILVPAPQAVLSG
ncbi:HWE histidine kinase domain-containing protein [Polymorphobacter sp.]|uniref:HWE histidine kinase domain-containing protein n=1 Tax=Polymorphobacter sp. TaxID=1909290 RepID=UPI003F6E6295